MSELIVIDDSQLRRLNLAIAAFQALPKAEQQRRSTLIEALEAERRHLAVCDSVLRRRALANPSPAKGPKAPAGKRA